MTEVDRYLRYWAKTSKEDPSLYHLVVYHCLDVAAAGRTILELRPRALARLSRAFGLEPSAVLDLVTLLLAFHDLGKLADGFQGLRPDLAEQLQGRRPLAPYNGRELKHDSLGYSVVAGLLAEGKLPFVIAPEAGRRARRCFAETWLAAAMGHHGVPPIVDLAKQSPGRHFPGPAMDDLMSTIGALAAIILTPDRAVDLSGLESEEERLRARRGSWLLAGLAVAADWVGSNAVWFPLRMGGWNPEAYFRDVALPRAGGAVVEAGLGERAPSPPKTFLDLFPSYAPTDLQGLAARLPIADGPQLVIVEEVTGGGKTEAAFLLAHRWIAGGCGDGLYVGLPTMATANAMYDRLRGIHGELFEPAAQPSLVLAHGRHHLRLALERAAEVAGTREVETASEECAAWLSSSRKKALLAEVGIGTIDQALLAILQARHQTLRLWGLAGKVLIVDEVHAADAYMQQLLAKLLMAHAASGGSAILLSATLSSAQRQRLGDAFARGSGIPAPELSDDTYPALVHGRATGWQVYPVQARAEASREIGVELLADESAVDAALASAVDEGGCACWIRNTVGDAVSAWERWVTRLGPERVTLFHSRFTVDDRFEIEREILARFGPESGPEQREGRLVIATQVVEQSLDIDFDVLVSDLAPIDLLIQRAGRLRRHRRATDGRRLDGPDERGRPVLRVFGPLPAQDCGEDWYSAFFPGGSFVYPDHGRLWLGASWLERRGRIEVPSDLRAAIEHVYSEEPGEVPAALLESMDRADGKGLADRSIATENAVDFDNGYGIQGIASSWSDDVQTPTRLGEPTTTVRLARLVDGRPRPWHEGDFAWERSEIQVRQSLVAGEWPGDEPLIQAAKLTMMDRGRYSVAVILGRAVSATGFALDRRGDKRVLIYSNQMGLTADDPRRA